MRYRRHRIQLVQLSVYTNKRGYFIPSPDSTKEPRSEAAPYLRLLQIAVPLINYVYCPSSVSVVNQRLIDPAPGS